MHEVCVGAGSEETEALEDRQMMTGRPVPAPGGVVKEMDDQSDARRMDARETR